MKDGWFTIMLDDKGSTMSMPIKDGQVDLSAASTPTKIEYQDRITGEWKEMLEHPEPMVPRRVALLVAETGRMYAAHGWPFESPEEAVQHHEKFVREEREQGKSCGSRTTERKRDTMTATVQSVREVARRVVAARVAGMHMLRIGDSLFNLSEEGMCLRFVRKVHEAALDQAEQTWAYRAQYAIYADYLLRRAGLECSDPESADVVCFNRWKPETARPGHIAVYLGDGMCAENTVSSKRGTPRVAGTKFSHLDEVDPDGSRRMFFRTVPMQTAALLRTDCVPIITMDSRILTVGKIEVSAAGNDVLMAPVRQLLEGLGHTVNADHLAAQGKCYIA